MSFPPNEFPERAPGCCTEGGSMVPLPGGRLAASQHYAKETRTSSFIFVLSHACTGGTKKKKKKSRFCAARKKASSLSCEDKPFWWNERRDTQCSSRDEWPVCSVVAAPSSGSMFCINVQKDVRLFLLLPLNGLWFMSETKASIWHSTQRCLVFFY